MTARLASVGTTGVEVDRHELREPSPYLFALERRTFLRVCAAMGAGVAVVATARADGQESGRRGVSGEMPTDVAGWLTVGADGSVTVFTGKTEIGQNIRTSLAQAVAEELRVGVGAVRLVMADTDRVPFDAGTYGSLSTPRMAPVLGRAAAAARELLIDRAAALWQVDRARLQARDGRISDGTRDVAYGDLVKDSLLTGTVDASMALTPRDRWAVKGTAPGKVDGRAFVTGAHRYTTDLVRPGMRRGVVVRPDGYGGTLGTVDAAAARGGDGVTLVRDGDLIGVVASTAGRARAAAATVRATWHPPAERPASTDIAAFLKARATPGDRPGGTRVGDVTAARSTAARSFAASYQIPYIAHVPLEPRAAVAEWTGDRVTVWCGTQRPFGVRAELAQAFRIAESAVRVIVPDTGSAYGGKHTGEHAIEAARLARAAGAPVKVTWTRAEEFSFGYARPAAAIDVSASVDTQGRLTAWEFDTWNAGASGIRTPYDVAHQRIEYHPSVSPLRQGSYRGLAATANHYVREMHMDLVARALGADALAFRLAHLSDARMRAVLERAAEVAGWPRASAEGRALGLACGAEKGGYVATAAEVSRGADGPRVHRLVVVFECGSVVHPDGVRQQVEGAVIQGLGGALFEALTFADGRLTNGTMKAYRVPRFRDVPAIEVVMLDRQDLPSVGAGETPIVAVAPAIGSAARAFGPLADALPITFARSQV